MKKNTKTYKAATKIVQALFDAGFIAYFAGGWVRDLMLDLPTDEIDIATSAPPQKIASLFSKTIPVGIAFGVMIVVEDDLHFEVSTFRKDHPYLDGRHPEGVDFSTPEKDAWRRDFTINGMFYDPLTETLHDFVGGQIDLEKKIIRAIGDPLKRFEEDRLRMLRAVRFSTKLNFSIDEETKSAICEKAPTLFPAVSIERIWQELLKMSKGPSFKESLELLYELRLLHQVFPELTHEGRFKKQITHFNRFPPATPLILYLLELFPTASLEKWLHLGEFLKVSNHDKHIIEFYFQAKTLLSGQPDPYQWAHFYANPLSMPILSVYSLQYPESHYHSLEGHINRQKELTPFIERILQHNPIITSARLMQLGIAPGPELGRLLKEAEKISINKKIENPEEILKILLPKKFI